MAKKPNINVRKKPSMDSTTGEKSETTVTESKVISESNVSEQAVENKSVRSSTARKREELKQRQQEREAQKLKTKTKTNYNLDQSELRRLTQEELLAEAKITEKINLASLDAYQKLELEKKKKTQTKLAIKGPLIRYHSVTMPLVKDEEENGQEEGSDALVKKQSRNFIIFPDEQTLRQAFPLNRTAKIVDVSKKICAVTGLPAKYFDPVTQKPYANLYAFKALREMHNKKVTPQNSQN